MKSPLFRQFKRAMPLVMAFTLLAFLTTPRLIEAKTKVPVEPSKLEMLLEKIKVINELLLQRQQFNTLGEAKIEGERPEYFSLKISDKSVKQLYGASTGNIVIDTDGGVSQILVQSECNKINGNLLLEKNLGCTENTWVSTYTEANGIRTFSLPINYETTDSIAQLNFKAYACRYNGCLFEANFSINYKESQTFADQIKIYDRYEWTYEWEDKIHHVQEVLLNFPYKEIRKVKLLVRCDVRGLYLSTDEKFRATCNNRREYSQPDFRKYTTDDQGNTFNLKIESVTDNIQKEQAGLVVMNFVFIDRHNNVVEVTHRPIQLEVEDEEKNKDGEVN